MNQTLSGLRAVITGASDGFGLSMSRALLRAGAEVALAARPGEKLERAGAALQAEGLKAHMLPMDVRSEASVAEAARWVEHHWGQPELLVNNAGLGMARCNPHFLTAPQKFFEIEVEAFQDMVNTNLMGYFTVAKYFAPLMIRKGRGRIVNISTGLQTMTRPGMAPYGASRAGAEALSRVMEQELREYGITVNILLPGGPARTGLLGTEPVPERMAAVLLPAEILDEAILFLASPEAEHISGARIIATEFDSWLREQGLRS